LEKNFKSRIASKCRKKKGYLVREKEQYRRRTTQPTDKNTFLKGEIEDKEFQMKRLMGGGEGHGEIIMKGWVERDR